MKRLYKAGMIGCGDYVRWLINDINNSKRFTVSFTYDLDPMKSDRRARELNALPVPSEDDIFKNPEVDIVLIFTPPWVRTDLFRKAAENGKHIITTKPLAPSYKEAATLNDIITEKVECAVFYARTGDAATESLKQIFESGEIGRLALYKEDWIHHYPQWNDWATDPEKNGGPFMDAMIHNLNKATYLIGEEVASYTFFSENHAQQLKCNDTEFLKISYPGGASAFLFITWAADLEVYSLSGNEREHIGILHMITDQGWYVTVVDKTDSTAIRARKENRIKEWVVEPLPDTPFDDFIERLESDKNQHITIDMAMKDIEILEKAMSQVQPAST